MQGQSRREDFAAVLAKPSLPFDDVYIICAITHTQ